MELLEIINRTARFDKYYTEKINEMNCEEITTAKIAIVEIF